METAFVSGKIATANTGWPLLGSDLELKLIEDRKMFDANEVVDENYFDGLVEFLRDVGGYDVYVCSGIDEGLFCRIESPSILGGFYIGKRSPLMNINIHYRVAADNEGCFDKWRKCPLVMKLPVNKTRLLKHLAWLGTEEGFKHSNNYDYLDNQILPLETQKGQYD